MKYAMWLVWMWMLVAVGGGLGGCSVLLSEGCTSEPGGFSPYVYQDRHDMESASDGWGPPVVHVEVDGRGYEQYAHVVHAPRELHDSTRYVVADVVTLGLAEVVTTPMELARLVGVHDYTEHLRAEWDTEGRLVSWMSGSAVDGGVRWSERKTVVPPHCLKRECGLVSMSREARELGEMR